MEEPVTVAAAADCEVTAELYRRREGGEQR